MMQQVDIKGRVVQEEDKSWTIEIYVFCNNEAVTDAPFIEKGFLEKEVALKYLEKYGNETLATVKTKFNEIGTIVGEEKLV